MTSILTNSSAMVALQTLKSINSGLSTTQNEISTGKKVATAKDNSAIWAISKVMESDVSGFGAISDSLNVGQSTVAVAAAGAEQVVETLKEMKDLAIAATSETADHAKIEQSMQEKQKQIITIINGSQFNGVNLLKSDTDGNGGTSFHVISSVDRLGSNDSAGSNPPTVSKITVNSVDFEADFGFGVDSTVGSAGTRTEITDALTAETVLGQLEGFLQHAIEGAADLGANAKRIDSQQNFVGKLTDAMKTGIGALVDANMEEASSRLQALQTQQQLGVQALSIANQQPQTLLSLFR